MKTFKLNDMIGEWFVGDFEPTTLRTSACEVALKHHKKGEFIAPHIHRIATEVNLVASGRVVVKGQEFKEGDIFILEPGDEADTSFNEDSVVVVVKVPSVVGDKYYT